MNVQSAEARLGQLEEVSQLQQQNKVQAAALSLEREGFKELKEKIDRMTRRGHDEAESGGGPAGASGAKQSAAPFAVPTAAPSSAPVVAAKAKVAAAAPAKPPAGPPAPTSPPTSPPTPPLEQGHFYRTADPVPDGMTRLSLPGGLTSTCLQENALTWQRHDAEKKLVRIDRWSWADDPLLGQQTSNLQIIPSKTNSSHPLLTMKEEDFQAAPVDQLIQPYMAPYGGPAEDDKKRSWSCDEAFGHKMLTDWRGREKEYCTRSGSQKTRVVCHPTTLFDRGQTLHAGSRTRRSSGANPRRAGRSARSRIVLWMGSAPRVGGGIAKSRRIYSLTRTSQLGPGNGAGSGSKGTRSAMSEWTRLSLWYSDLV